MTTFKFVDEDDLPRQRGPVRDALLSEFADALRENPGKWAEYPRPIKNAGTRSSLAYFINKPTGANQPPVPFRSGEFEATNRSGLLYVRYVGGGAE